MALILPSITLSSGLTLSNALAVISELNVSNNISSNERLEIASAPGDDASEINQNYKIVSTNNGGKNGTYFVSLFIGTDAFADGKPPVEQYKDGRSVKVFSVNLLADEYKDLTPREAAYKHLLKQSSFIDGTLAPDINV